MNKTKTYTDVCTKFFQSQYGHEITLEEYLRFVDSCLLERWHREAAFYGESIAIFSLVDKYVAQDLFEAAIALKRFRIRVDNKIQEAKEKEVG